jgi:transposase
MRKIEMEKAREILRQHFELGLTQREISKSVGTSLGTVSGILSKARAAGIEYPLKLSSKELGIILYPPTERQNKQKIVEPDLEYIHREMQKKGITLTLLWEEYKTENPDGLMYTQFCDRYRAFRKSNDVYMRKIYKAGERVLVDWAGLTMSYTDKTGEVCPAYIFVAVLPASSYLYVEAFRNMKESSWIEAHVNAFEYFGGVPLIVVPDNPKTAITKANYHDPVANRTYAEMAKHYGTAIIPTRTRAPRDKAPVEKGVQVAERRIIAKLRNRQFFDFASLWIAVRDELKIVNQEPFKKLPGDRLSVFTETEKPLLRALPPTRYEFAEWKSVKSGMDYHIEFDKHYYSVPYNFAGKQLDVRATLNVIEVFYEQERVVSHIRNYRKDQRYMTLPEHMPSNHRAMSEWSVERFESWAGKFGPDTRDYICFLMQHRDHPEQAFKTCAGILRLGKTAPNSYMEIICRTAKEKNVFSYKYFNMLFKQMTSEQEPLESKPVQHENLRGSSYYGGGSYAG